MHIGRTLVLSCLVATRVIAQPTANAPLPTANEMADFPDAPTAGERDGASGYVFVGGGRATTFDVTAPVGDIEAGVRLSRHLSLFGAVGLARSLRPSSVQPYVDIAVARIAQRDISVSGSARDPAWYTLGGLRFDVPTSLRLSPFGLVGAGWSHSAASAQFSYRGGSSTVTGGIASEGQDATSDVLSTGVFIGDSWGAPMIRVAAGLGVPVSRSWSAEVRYSWSRMLTATAIDVHGPAAGLGFKF